MPMSSFALAAALALAASLAAAGGRAEADWDAQPTAHFLISHQREAMSLGDYNKLERVYDALRPDLWPLVPSMANERTRLYLYKDRESFLAGRFSPPAWSGGLFSEREGEKALALFEPLDTATAAHELTHLYFHAYFGEQAAPPWLDEGLASMLQNEALTLLDPRDKGPVLRGVLPLAEFFKARPERDSPAARVSAWYQQAHSVTRFIKRGHIEASFPAFCGKLRDGTDTETALREVYGYADLAAFQKAWDQWRPRKAVGQP